MLQNSGEIKAFWKGFREFRAGSKGFMGVQAGFLGISEFWWVSKTYSGFQGVLEGIQRSFPGIIEEFQSVEGNSMGFREISGVFVVILGKLRDIPRRAIQGDFDGDTRHFRRLQVFEGRVWFKRASLGSSRTAEERFRWLQQDTWDSGDDYERFMGLVKGL